MTRLKVELPKDGMVLTPDQAMLDDPSTVYPVMIDPAWNTPNAADWAGVSRYYPRPAVLALHLHLHLRPRLGRGLLRRHFSLRTHRREAGVLPDPERRVHRQADPAGRVRHLREPLVLVRRTDGGAVEHELHLLVA